MAFGEEGVGAEDEGFLADIVEDGVIAGWNSGDTTLNSELIPKPQQPPTSKC
jgi:hypothetical protein